MLSEETAATIMRGVFSGLAYLHSEVNVIHRDLKPANVVIMTADSVTDSSQVVLIDFGLAVKASKYDLLDYAQCGTILYEPPEQIRKKFAHAKVSHTQVVILSCVSARVEIGHVGGRHNSVRAHLRNSPSGQRLLKGRDGKLPEGVYRAQLSRCQFQRGQNFRPSQAPDRRPVPESDLWALHGGASLESPLDHKEAR